MSHSLPVSSRRARRRRAGSRSRIAPRVGGAGCWRRWGRLLAAVGPALVAAPRAGGDDASLITEARPRGRPPSGVFGWLPSQLVPSAGRGGEVVWRGCQSELCRLTGQLGRRGVARRKRGHRTPQLGLRHGARSRGGRWKPEVVGLPFKWLGLRSIRMQEELG